MESETIVAIVVQCASGNSKINRLMFECAEECCVLTEQNNNLVSQTIYAVLFYDAPPEPNQAPGIRHPQLAAGRLVNAVKLAQLKELFRSSCFSRVHYPRTSLITLPSMSTTSC